MSSITAPLTVINSTDTISASRTTLNTNFALRHAMNVREIADADSPYTWQLGDDALLVTSTASVVNVNLPPAASYKGTTIQVVIALDTGGGVVLDGNAAETINGSTTQALTGTYGTMRLFCTGTGWTIIELYP